MYLSNAPTFGTQSIPIQGTYTQPQVVAQPVAPTGYVSPFAMHGGYFQPPVNGGISGQNAPVPLVDPYCAAYASNHPSYVPREPIHPSEQGMHIYQQPEIYHQPRDAWEYEMQRKQTREERLNYRRREPGSLFGWDPRDPPPPRRDPITKQKTTVTQGGRIKSIE